MNCVFIMIYLWFRTFFITKRKLKQIKQQSIEKKILTKKFHFLNNIKLEI